MGMQDSLQNLCQPLRWVLLCGLAGLTAGAQTTISSATLTATDGADELVNGRNYLGQTLAVDTFDAGGNTYAITGTADTIFVRRGGVGGNESQIWYETTSGGGNRLSAYVNDVSEAILGNNLRVGTQNLFANTGLGSANVERVDLIASGGFTAAQGFAIPVFDFGTNPEHDGASLALVTSIDGAGNPTSYSDLVTTGAFTATNIHNHGTFSIEYYNSGDDTSGAPYTIFEGTNQGPGGVVIELDDFGVSAGTTIYGYSLFGSDVSTGGDSSNLLDWTDPTYFPTNTSGTTRAAGGLDFAAVNGVFFQDIAFAVVPEPSATTLGGIVVIFLALARRRYRPRPSTS